MEEKRLYLIAQFDTETNRKLAQIYDKLAENSLQGEQPKNIPYHITLGNFDLADKTQIIERTKNICLRTKPFKINLSNIAMFGLKVLFISPAVNTELLKLYSDLVPNETLSGYHNWVAHATILIDNPANIKSAIPIVAEAFTPFTATIESIGVVEFPPVKYITEFELCS